MLRTQAVCRSSSQQNWQGKFELFAWTLSSNLFPLNWTFRLLPKRQLGILLNFFPLTNLFLAFVVFACFATTRVTMRFRTKNTECSTGLYQVCATSYWLLAPFPFLFFAFSLLVIVYLLVIPFLSAGKGLVLTFQKTWKCGIDQLWEQWPSILPQILHQ